MKYDTVKHDTVKYDATSYQQSGEVTAVPATNSVDVAGAHEDRLLVENCLAHKPGAWDILYAKCQPALLTAIRFLLANKAADDDLVEEIAARVWYAVVREKGKGLDRFDAGRGCRLTTFLAAIARHEVLQHFRSERRRRVRERQASNSQGGPTPDDLLQTQVLFDEFSQTLTPREKEFFDSHLICQPRASQIKNLTAANAWQLKHRVQTKLRGFLEQA